MILYGWFPYRHGHQKKKDQASIRLLKITLTIVEKYRTKDQTPEDFILQFLISSHFGIRSPL